MDLIEFNDLSITQKERHPWEQMRFRLLDFFIQSIDKENILDIGSGDCYISSSLGKKYEKSTVIAVDINYNRESIEKINKIKPDNLYLTDKIETGKNILTRDADLVLLMDVLEHLENPDQLLNSICTSKINEKTVFFITVPAYQFLFSEHDLKLGHKKRYNKKSLSDLLYTNKFEILYAGYAFNTLVAIRFLQKLFEIITGKHFTTSSGIQHWNKGKIITQLIVTIFSIEFKISWYLSRIGIKVPGLTCYCLCRYSP